MPIFLEPDQSFPVYLDSDKSKPIESRPVFLARSQSMRGQKKILDTLDRLTEEGVTVEELFREIVATLASVLTGWRNMGGIEFSEDSIMDVLSYHEARELLRLVAYNQRMDAEEKKS